MLATPPAECLRRYKVEHALEPHGAYKRTWTLTVGYSYQNLRLMLRSLQRSEGRQWKPVLFPVIVEHDGDAEYRCSLPNGVAITIKRHYYSMGAINGSWWHLYWPTFIDASHYPLRTINTVHQIDTLKEARALIKEYIANDYTTPKGAWTP